MGPGDHPDSYTVNVRDLLVMFFEMRVTEQADQAFRRQLTRFQEHARAALEVEALSAQPRDVRQVLWTTFRGEEFAWRLQAHGYEAIGWLLDECTGVPS